MSQVVKKLACGDFFDKFAPFAYEPTTPRAASGDRNPLLREGSETTVHAAGFGLAVRGLRPSNISGVCQQSDHPFYGLMFICALVLCVIELMEDKLLRVFGEVVSKRSFRISWCRIVERTNWEIE